MNNVFYRLLAQYCNETPRKCKTTSSLKALEEFLAKGVTREIKTSNNKITVVGEDDWVYISKDARVDAYYILTRPKNSNYAWKSEKTPRKSKEAAKAAVLAIESKGVLEAKIDTKRERISDADKIKMFIDLNAEKLNWVNGFMEVSASIPSECTKSEISEMFACVWENGYLTSISGIRVALVSERSDAEFIVDNEYYMLVRDVKFSDIADYEPNVYIGRLREENPSAHHADLFDAKNLVMYSIVDESNLLEKVRGFER